MGINRYKERQGIRTMKVVTIVDVNDNDDDGYETTLTFCVFNQRDIQWKWNA